VKEGAEEDLVRVKGRLVDQFSPEGVMSG
jgi:hypothetical protein